MVDCCRDVLGQEAGLFDDTLVGERLATFRKTLRSPDAALPRAVVLRGRICRRRKRSYAETALSIAVVIEVNATWSRCPRPRGCGRDDLRSTGCIAGRADPPRRRRTKAFLAGAAVFLLAAPAASEGWAADEANIPSVWTYSFYKTVTYEFFANLADVPLYYSLLGGGAASSVLFNGVNVVTAAAAYYSYEVGWNLYGPPIGGQPLDVAVEAEIKKTLLYRVVSTARNLLLGYAFTGSPGATIGFAVVSNIVDGAIYIANEYGWYAYGPAPPSGESVPFPDLAAAAGLSWPGRDTFEVSAIAVGAVAGVITANVATGGMATPVLALGTPVAAAVQGGAAYIGGAATTAIGALGGGYVVDWLYPQ